MKGLYIIGAGLSVLLAAACSGNGPALEPGTPLQTQPAANAQQGREMVRRPTAAETVVWSFGAPGYKSCYYAIANGLNPLGGLLAGKNGSFYGTTSGEVSDCGDPGQVFEMVPLSSGGYAKRTLYYFGGTGSSNPYDGTNPQGELIADTSGALYGTTSHGGQYGHGTVFKLMHARKGWKETILYSFQGFADGSSPQSGLVMDSSGALYGTTSSDGGSNKAGTIFKLTPGASGWNETILHVFSGYPSDGANPVGRLLYVAKNGGTLYGTTSSGGSEATCDDFPCGAVFKLDLSTQSYGIIYNFSGPDGAFPQAGLVADKKGNLYGTTFAGGSGSCTYTRSGCGTVFKLERAGSAYSQAFSYSFQGATNSGPDGAYPKSSLLLDKAGNIYGTTQHGGTGICGAAETPCGTIFKLARSNGAYAESVIYSFGTHASYNDGWYPVAPVVLKNGRLYGTTPSGGMWGDPCCNGGTVFVAQP